jgi:hypothetical protein
VKDVGDFVFFSEKIRALHPSFALFFHMIPYTCPQPVHIWQTFGLRARALDYVYGKRLSQFLEERQLRAVSRPQEIQTRC